MMEFVGHERGDGRTWEERSRMMREKKMRGKNGLKVSRSAEQTGM